MTIVGVPTEVLGVQWKEVLEGWGYKTILTMGSADWKTQMGDAIRLYENNEIDNLCIVTSYATYVNEKFHDKLRQTKIKKLLIADEVHHTGAPDAQNGLIPDYDYRLGLTATLERYFDPEGTKIIEDYFGGTVYNYKMAQGIDAGTLSKYKYHMRLVDLTPNEYVKYRNYSILWQEIGKKRLSSVIQLHMKYTKMQLTSEQTL